MNEPSEPSAVNLTPKECAEQFRLYAKTNPSRDSQHSLTFCAEFLDKYCHDTETAALKAERDLFQSQRDTFKRAMEHVTAERDALKAQVEEAKRKCCYCGKPILYAVERGQHEDGRVFHGNCERELFALRSQVERLTKENLKFQAIEEWMGVDTSKVYDKVIELRAELEAVKKERDEKERQLRLIGFYGPNLGDDWKSLSQQLDTSLRKQEAMREVLERARCLAREGVALNIETIDAALAEKNEPKDETPAVAPTPDTPLPWFHRHPMGGREIYADGDAHEPLARFNNEADCDYAIACANTHQSLERERNEALSKVAQSVQIETRAKAWENQALNWQVVAEETETERNEALDALENLRSGAQVAYDRLMWAIQFLDSEGDHEKGAPWPDAREWLNYAKPHAAECREALSTAREVLSRLRK